MDKSFLGRGWKFPVTVDKVTGRIRMSEYEDDIAEAIRIILRTAKGERVMRHAFGSDANQFVFGTVDATSLRLLENSIGEAIRDWEPRVEQIAVSVAPDPDAPQRVLIYVSYVVRSTNHPFNQVYPFYLDDGVDIDVN